MLKVRNLYVLTIIIKRWRGGILSQWVALVILRLWIRLAVAPSCNHWAGCSKCSHVCLLLPNRKFLWWLYGVIVCGWEDCCRPGRQLELLSEYNPHKNWDQLQSQLLSLTAKECFFIAMIASNAFSTLVHPGAASEGHGLRNVWRNFLFCNKDFMTSWLNPRVVIMQKAVRLQGAAPKPQFTFVLRPCAPPHFWQWICQ